jgi:hypothetical protein
VQEFRGACKQQFGLPWSLKGVVGVGDALVVVSLAGSFVSNS